MTSEDLTLTVLAPASFTSPPTVVSLNSSPSTPMSPFVGLSEFTGKASADRRRSAMQRPGSAPLLSDLQKQNGDGGARSVSFNERASPTSDVVPSTGLGCSHLWLQSRVPLGYSFILLLLLIFVSLSLSEYIVMLIITIYCGASDVFLLNLRRPSSLSYFH